MLFPEKENTANFAIPLPLGEFRTISTSCTQIFHVAICFCTPVKQTAPSALNRGSHDADASHCSGDDRRRYSATRLAQAEAVDASGRVSLRSPLRHRRNALRKTRDRRRHRPPEERSGHGRRRETSSSGWLGPCIRHPVPGVAPAMTAIDATPQRGSLGPKPSTQATAVFRSGRHDAIDATPPFVAPAMAVDATSRPGLLGPQPSTQAVALRSGHLCAIDATLSARRATVDTTTLRKNARATAVDAKLP